MERENLAQMYAEMISFAHRNQQVVGEKSDYYLTLEQIEAFVKKFMDAAPRP